MRRGRTGDVVARQRRESPRRPGRAASAGRIVSATPRPQSARRRQRPAAAACAPPARAPARVGFVARLVQALLGVGQRCAAPLRPRAPRRGPACGRRRPFSAAAPLPAPRRRARGPARAPLRAPVAASSCARAFSCVRVASARARAASRAPRSCARLSCASARARRPAGSCSLPAARRPGSRSRARRPRAAGAPSRSPARLVVGHPRAQRVHDRLQQRRARAHLRLGQDPFGRVAQRAQHVAVLGEQLRVLVCVACRGPPCIAAVSSASRRIVAGSRRAS